MWVVDLFGRTHALDLVEGSHETAGHMWSFHQIQQVCSDNHELVFVVYLMISL